MEASTVFRSHTTSQMNFNFSCLFQYFFSLLLPLYSPLPLDPQSQYLPFCLNLFFLESEIESCEENSEYLCLSKKRQESGDLRFFKNMELLLECFFMLFPAVADRSKFTSGDSLLLSVVIKLNV